MDYKDNLILCQLCNSDACYHTEGENGYESWFCFTCGYATSTDMIPSSGLVKKARDQSAELIKDLEVIHNNLVWYPSIVKIPNKGIVFPDGTGKNDWRWGVIQEVEIPEEERKGYIKPGTGGKEFYTHKMDQSTLQHFGQLEFMDCLELIGFFENLEPIENQ